MRPEPHPSGRGIGFQVACATLVVLLAATLGSGCASMGQRDRWEGYRTYGPNEREVSHRFRVHADDAVSVHIMGTFNDWDPASLALRPVAGVSGYWEITLQLPPGEHEFGYLVARASDHSQAWLRPPNAVRYVPSGWSDPAGVSIENGIVEGPSGDRDLMPGLTPGAAEVAADTTPSAIDDGEAMAAERPEDRPRSDDETGAPTAEPEVDPSEASDAGVDPTADETEVAPTDAPEESAAPAEHPVETPEPTPADAPVGDEASTPTDTTARLPDQKPITEPVSFTTTSEPLGGKIPVTGEVPRVR